MKTLSSRTITLLTTMALTAAPVLAQDRGRANHGGESRGRAVERAQPRESAAPRAETRREAVAPRVEPPRVESPRAGVIPRVETRREVVVPRAVPRSEVIAPRVARPYYVRPYNARPYYARPYYAPLYVYRPYVFRPRFSFGLGVFVGYPFAYPYAYPYAVPVYGYGAPPAPVVVGPTSSYYGGVSLEFSPGEAAVYVDGNYAGTVNDFDGTRQPLNLTAGTHHIELQAPGFEPMAFDVTVQPGQVIPYRGDLQPTRY
jgi:PEGA domain-containing protein